MSSIKVALWGASVVVMFGVLFVTLWVLFGAMGAKSL